MGIGGVGSWAAEALARTGVGHLTLVDLDEVCVSNVNRQVHALTSTVGRLKGEAETVPAGFCRPAYGLVNVETHCIRGGGVSGAGKGGELGREQRRGPGEHRGTSQLLRRGRGRGAHGERRKGRGRREVGRGRRSERGLGRRGDGIGIVAGMTFAFP